MDFFNEQPLVVIVIIGLLIILAYSIVSVLINKLNNVINGKTTILAWIPVTNTYLLGKLVVNKVIGILLSVLLLFGIIISFNIPGLENIKNLIPSGVVLPYKVCYGLLIIVLLLIGKSKLDKIIREGNGKDAMSKFIAKNYDDKESITTEEVKPKEVETIKDEYQYNHTSLSDLSHLNDNSNKNNP